MTKHLFICGCARSGTTAVALLLNTHPDIALGVERYRDHLFDGNELTPAHFAPEAFFSQLSMHPRNAEPLRSKFNKVTYRGDKIPKLHAYLDQIERNFPEAKVIFLVRNVFDVALSFKTRANDLDDDSWPATRDIHKAILEWNASLRSIFTWINRVDGFVLDYEELFHGTGDMRSLLDYLSLGPSSDMERKLEQNRRFVIRREQNRGAVHLTADEKRHIALNAEFRLYGLICGMQDRSLKSVPVDVADTESIASSS